MYTSLLLTTFFNIIFLTCTLINMVKIVINFSKLIKLRLLKLPV